MTVAISALSMRRVCVIVPPVNSSRLESDEYSSDTISPSSAVPFLSLTVSARAQSAASIHAVSIRQQQVRIDSSLGAMNLDRDVLAARDAELFYLNGHRVGHLAG